MMPAPERRGVVVLALGTTQTLAWASSYYLPAILADPIARELGISPTAVFAAFSAALLLSAALSSAVGRAIDRRGGRGVLCLSNLVFAIGLVLLAAAQGCGFHAPLRSSPVPEAVRAVLRREVPVLAEDRYFAPDIEAATRLVASGAIAAPAHDMLPELESP